ncbi:MAG: agmatinase [Acidobacteriales bacterium]|nr:agmatinase [Terriglobales bacterium]
MPSTPKLALIGIPFDGNSSYLRGTAEAPARIREALHCDSTNTWTEDGWNIAEQLQDRGDVRFEAAGDPMQAITEFVGNALREDFRPVILGGDHSLTYATVRAFAGAYPNLTILHFDAHPDLYDEFQGNRYSHACPFARIMEADLARRLVQVGIRTANEHQREQVGRFGVEMLEMKDWHGQLPKLESPVYVSFDLDVLDPAFAPGVSHHEPGGMTTREAIAAIQSIEAEIVGADVVELNPQRDPLGITAMCAAKIVKELAAKIIA